MARVLERPHYTVDPMLGRLQSPDPTLYRNLVNDIRMGDRILVHKLMYPFFEPSRWDVVVFKNPTAPVGDAENFIKRLIGLPREKIWLADGDVFAGPATTGDRLDDFVVQRKPEFVQRAVWQPVHHGAVYGQVAVGVDAVHVVGARLRQAPGQQLDLVAKKFDDSFSEGRAVGHDTGFLRHSEGP